MSAAAPPRIDLRAAQRADVPLILGFVRELADYERLADTVVVVPSEQYSEPVTVGEYTKAVSNLDCDPTAIFNRM